MFEKVKFENFNALIDPETNFWVVYDENIDVNILNFYENKRKEFLEDMRRYRFAIEPKTAYINPTEKCNMNCPYCYIPHKIRQRGESMSYQTLEDVLGKLAEIGIERVIFHGAEPMLVKDRIFRAIEEFDFKFGIQTNATLIEEEDAEFLINNSVSIGISFDSHIRNVDELLRGKGHYDAVLKILEYFEGYGRLNVITTVNKYNYSHLDGLIDFLAGKVEVLLANPVRGTSSGGRRLRPPEGFEKYYIRAVERAIEHTKNGRRIVIGDFANILLGLIAPTSRVLQCDISPCGAGRRFFAISVDGIYPCGEFIGMEEFRALTLEEMNKRFELLRERVVERIGECCICVFRNLCGAPCPAEIYAEKGTLYAKSPYCEFYKNLAMHALRVIARGDVENVLKLKNLRKIYEFIKN